jgi:spore cortex formation protein SpoVR/YcgB (stage V sporulation)
MLRKLAVLALVLSLSGCSTEAEDKQVLIDYVAQLQALDDKNKQVAETIEHLRKPIGEISAGDLATARQLIVDYVTQLQALPRDLSYRELRVTHNLYVDKVTMAIELSGDKGREMRREKSNVDIGVRHIEKFTRRHHNGMNVLWDRHRLPDFPLTLPE